MKRSLLVFAVLIAIATAGVQPAAAQNRYIVRTTGGLTSVLNLCLSAGCQVQGSLDGNINQTFLVTSTTNLVVDVVNFTVNLLESLLGIQSIEPDLPLPVPQTRLDGISYGLYDTTLVKYYGALVIHGYAAQPAVQIIRLIDAQNGFNISGTGIVAVIDTGVDPNHPVLHPVMVQQSSAAILDQSSAAILDGSPYVAFGHGTMTAGLVHLVAPKAKILPLKAFSSNGTGNLSNIVAALYYAV